MARAVLSRFAGAILVIYGIAIILSAWWAYSVTHQAFSSVRSFVATFERERNAAVGALQDAVGLVGGGDGSTSTSGSPAGVAPRVQSVRDRLRGLIGGGQQAGASDPSGSGLDILDRLESRLEESKNRWLQLGDGPVSLATLDRVELATNVILAWLAVTGVLGIVFGGYLLVRRVHRAPAAAAWAPPYPAQTGPMYPPLPGSPGYPPAPPPYPPARR